jgi:hypothetical protein
MSFPGQELRPETATEWFDELVSYPAERVWAAVRRCRREQRFRPTLADLLDAIEFVAREQAAARPRIAAPDRPGVPPPPEAKRLLAALRGRIGGAP